MPSTGLQMTVVLLFGRCSAIVASKTKYAGLVLVEMSKNEVGVFVSLFFEEFISNVLSKTILLQFLAC